LTWRYGAKGPGVASYAEVGAVRATGHSLLERSRRTFSASNAVLVLDGPPPAGLSLPLPAGEYLPAPTATPLDRVVPAAYRDEAGLTLSGVVTRTHEASFLSDILERSLHDGLRRHSGGAYGLWSGMTEVDNQHAVVGAGADVLPETLPSLARAALEVTQRLADDGVPREWVQEAVQARLRVLESPAAMVETALEAAYSVLRDQVPVTYEELLQRLHDTDPARVDHAARELHASLLVGLPEAAPLGRTIPAVTFPESPPIGTGQKHSHVNWPADLTTFSVDEHVAERVTGAVSRSMRLADVVALLAWRDGARHLIGQDGDMMELEPREWMRGKDLSRALDAAIPADRHVPMPDRAVTFRRMSTTERAAVAFARVANTRIGLLSMLGVVAVLATWSMITGHRIVGFFFLLLASALGAHLWRTEMDRTPGTPSSPASSATT
jgi:hypothetical protein